MSDLETYTVDGEGLTINLILWRRYKRRVPGLVEKTLDINPGLAEQGPYIRPGTVIVLPYLPPPIATERQLVRLWT